VGDWVGHGVGTRVGEVYIGAEPPRLKRTAEIFCVLTMSRAARPPDYNARSRR